VARSKKRTVLPQVVPRPNGGEIEVTLRALTTRWAWRSRPWRGALEHPHEDALSREAQRTARSESRRPSRGLRDRRRHDSRLERSFWAWHAQAKADVARVVRAIESGTFEVEVKRVFRVEITVAQSRATARLVPSGQRGSHACHSHRKRAKAVGACRVRRGFSAGADGAWMTS
jgi:hypothetical protein